MCMRKQLTTGKELSGPFSLENVAGNTVRLEQHSSGSLSKGTGKGLPQPELDTALNLSDRL